ncbi:hypothetical protein ACFQ22_11595 [Lentilactobacillus raoultii]|uniref:Surface layer protein A domain-containing protein n=1 Tax=Lentilactobacillus raoultii TaxID=1987503 RepID=A0ABW3PLZ9_9LACO|nr:hypothetical protein [Lentilactobacillus raoultii]
MKFNRFFLIAILSIVFTVIPINIHASSDPDAVPPHQISKKQLTNLQKKYRCLDNVSYYKAKRSAPVTFSFYDTNNPKIVHQRTVQIPKGTVIIGNKLALNSKTNTPNIFQFNINTLSYALKKSWVNDNTQHPDLYTKDINSINNTFSKISRPAYMPVYSEGAFYKYLGDKVDISPWNASTDQVKLTSDGYVEFRKINPGQDTDHLFNLVPVSSSKIYKTLVKRNTRYLYYSHHLKGVNDRKIANSGPTKYRLAVRNLHHPFTLFDGDQGEVIMSKYQVGNATYYTEDGAYSE